MGWYYVITEEMRGLDLKGNNLNVYAVIAGFSRDGSGCFYGSRAYLAELAGCSINTVDRCLADLCREGYIRKSKTVNADGEIVVTYEALPKMGDTPKMGYPHPQNGDTPTPKLGDNNKGYKEIDKKDTLSIRGSQPFKKPSLEDVRAYCFERNNTVSPEAFIAFYESNGWKVGKNPMKDWRAAVRTWEQRDRQNPSPRSARPSPQKEDNYVTNGLRILKEIREGTFMQNIYGNE